MTLEEMLRMVRILSNSCFVRWWAHWNNKNEPWEIAFCAIEENGKEAFIDLGRARDLVWDIETFCGKKVYVFQRLNDDGSPYFSARLL